MGIKTFSRCTCADTWFCTELLFVLPTFSPSPILSAFYQFVNSHSQMETSLGSFHCPLAAGCHGDMSVRGAVLHVSVLRGTCQPCLGCGSCQSHPLKGWRCHSSISRAIPQQDVSACVESLHRQSLLAWLPQIPGRSMSHRLNVGKPAIGNLIVNGLKPW